MKEGTASSAQKVHPLVETSLGSKSPIAKLIGYEMEYIGEGRAVMTLNSGVPCQN